jgi:hypothetical protein
MKCTSLLNRKARPVHLAVSILAAIAVGCSSTKSNEKPKSDHVSLRGWIGGQYEKVDNMPQELRKTQKAGLLLTELSSQSPMGVAGLKAGDLVLELNHQPVCSLRKFYKTVDATPPGTVLPMKAWHEGQVGEYSVRTGRETYVSEGSFAFALPPFVEGLDLWPDPGFSLAILGYQPEWPQYRKELESPRELYYKKCDPKDYRTVDKGWRAWLVIFKAEASKSIRSQEILEQ